MKTFDSPQQRNELLATLATWEGRLSNRRVRDIFGIGLVRASQWIRAFREQHPDWLMFDSKTRSHVATDAVFHAWPSAKGEYDSSSVTLGSYLNLVGLPASTKGGAPDQVVWAAFPDLSPPRPQIFSLISDAIRGRRVITITYRSMRDPQPHSRTISPHSMVRAGRRWHVRAYCDESEGFRDYALRRIVDVQQRERSAEHSAADDRAWMATVPVRLIAHPLLSVEQQDLIRFEYFGNTAARIDTCRGALVPYFIQDVRAALDPETERPPDFQLAVENLHEVRPWVFST